MSVERNQVKLFALTISSLIVLLSCVLFLTITVKRIEYAIFLKPYVTAEVRKLEIELEQIRGQCFTEGTGKIQKRIRRSINGSIEQAASDVKARRNGDHTLHIDEHRELARRPR